MSCAADTGTSGGSTVISRGGAREGAAGADRKCGSACSRTANCFEDTTASKVAATQALRDSRHTSASDGSCGEQMQTGGKKGQPSEQTAQIAHWESPIDAEKASLRCAGQVHRFAHPAWPPSGAAGRASLTRPHRRAVPGPEGRQRAAGSPPAAAHHVHTRSEPDHLKEALRHSVDRMVRLSQRAGHRHACSDGHQGCSSASNFEERAHQTVAVSLMGLQAHPSAQPCDNGSPGARSCAGRG